MPSFLPDSDPGFHTRRTNLGATWTGTGTRFLLWAPAASKVELRLTAPQERIVTMEPTGRGYFEVFVDHAGPGTQYLYRLNDSLERPDPASRYQPRGVHGPSQVIDPNFTWTSDSWHGLPLRDYVIYEVHTGTFTTEATFDAIIPRLPALVDLGVTALELMPVAQFPGSRNWGYDGVYPFAVQNSYGGPEGLKRLVDACHRHKLSVILDVVYNHLGPEGNYLANFGPYFTERYKTPWGQALNFDGPASDNVRRFFIENALYWVTDCRIDALRLDAIHAILDHSAVPFLQELAEAVRDRAKQLNRTIHTIAESALNDSRILRAAEFGGCAIDGQWNDDFHHSLHTLLTGERDGYYQDYGEFGQLVKAFREGYVYSGEYSSFRKRRHGNSSRWVTPHRLVVFSQNHDQIGNRMLGERLTALVSFEKLKLAAGAVLLSPFVPLLFMGEEYGEPAPFQYFVSHLDPALVEAVRRGRTEEFAAFAWQGECPDPQDEQTFLRSRPNAELSSQGRHKVLRDLYKELIHLRQTVPAIGRAKSENSETVAYEGKKVLFVRRWQEDREVLIAYNFEGTEISVGQPLPVGRWRKIFDSTDEKWEGSAGSLPAEIMSEGTATFRLEPFAFGVFLRAKET